MDPKSLPIDGDGGVLSQEAASSLSRARERLGGGRGQAGAFVGLGALQGGRLVSGSCLYPEWP